VGFPEETDAARGHDGLVSDGIWRCTFFIEFTRQPDAQLGFVLGFLSMGQLLCLGMILAGIGVLAWLTLQEHRDS
jgi:prolipoprotein diacylglyceryltransferase